jgi:hypothetical protein
VKIGFARDVLVTVPKGTAAKMKPALERKDPLVAPLAENAPVGKLKMMVDDKSCWNCPSWRWSRQPGDHLWPRLGFDAPVDEISP